MIELLGFQQEAAQQIADRFLEYLDDPVTVGTVRQQRVVPFFQALSSLTASGKTVILAEVVSTVSGALDPSPVVLWMSKYRVVVEQSYANLLPGGKYHHLLGNAEVRALDDYDTREAVEATTAMVYLATVGKFNRRDKKNRRIYTPIEDQSNERAWDSLKSRLDTAGRRRPLIVVYDEAQNLSPQQTELLLELEPDAFLLASATMTLSRRLADEVDELRRRGRSDEWLVTNVDARLVADSGLVKNKLSMAGYLTPMEETLNAMLADMKEAEVSASAYGLPGPPKAIYVTNTNTVEGDAYLKDEPKRPWLQRQAPPILIWRYLVEHCGVDPAEIAVYANLAMHKDYPAPRDFVLFKGGESDYDDFSRGNYRHIIFNLTLQEGWDDPLAYFAYIDKSMESPVQITQIIGRLLRQPGARHYAADRLNTAHFYVRVDRNEVFDGILKEVEERMQGENPNIRIVATPPGRMKPEEWPVLRHAEVPGTAYEPRAAAAPVAALIDGLTDYRGDSGANTRAKGSRRISVRTIGRDGSVDTAWQVYEQAATVSCRWVFQREVRRRFAGALMVSSVATGKFDARVGIQSNAYKHVVQVAERVVDVFLESVYLAQKRVDPYVVGPTMVRPDAAVPFQHALHAGYDGLNELELSCARLLDGLGHTWCRNSPRTGYGIPLVSVGTTRNFYPDFLVWKDDVVIAVDTKGGHILPEAAARKLLKVDAPSGTSTRLLIRFVSPGRWSANVESLDKAGFTVWGLKQDGTRRAAHYADLSGAVDAALDTRLD